MTNDSLGAIHALRQAAAEENAPRKRSVAAHFEAAMIWVELTERGSVSITDDNWVYAYTDPGMLPGGLLAGFSTENGLEVEAIQMTGERLRSLVGPDVGIVLDYEFPSQSHIQYPPATPVSPADDD